MFSEKLTRIVTHDNSHTYIATHAGYGARKKAYAQYKELKQWWKESVDETDERGGVAINGNTGVSPADYTVCVRFTDEKNALLFKLRFEHEDNLPTIIPVSDETRAALRSRLVRLADRTRSGGKPMIKLQWKQFDNYDGIEFSAELGNNIVEAEAIVDQYEDWLAENLGSYTCVIEDADYSETSAYGIRVTFDDKYLAQDFAHNFC
jgi:hypothetical protein